MINVQPYINQLDDLKAYMDFYIEVLYAKTFFDRVPVMCEVNKRMALITYLQVRMYQELGIPENRN